MANPPNSSEPHRPHWTVRYYKAAWVVVILLALALAGAAYKYISNKQSQAAAAAQLEQKKQEARAKAEEQRRKKEQQARAEAARKRQQEEAARRAAQQASSVFDEDEDDEDDEDKDEEPTPKPEPDVSDEGGEDAEETDEPVVLQLKKPTEEDNKLYVSMLKETLESKDFAGLRDKLKAAIDASYPELTATAAPAQGQEEEEGSTTEAMLPRLPRQATPMVKSAISTYLCLDMALRYPAEDPKAQAAFCAWLMENKTKAATAFIQGLAKYKVTSAADAAVMFEELRDFYIAEPKKAFAEIKRITNPVGNKVGKKLYPNTDRKKIEAEIANILKNKDKGTPADQQEAVNKLNVFRYLCGVSPTVVYDKTYAEQAGKAAAACRAKGELSHELGEFTDVCNLHTGGFSKMGDTVGDYMRDPGDNNREKRGHRMWCLHPQLGKTGFGQADSFHAMRVTDLSAKSPTKTAYSYPGRGFFPVAWLDGDGWSYYAPSGVDLGSEVKVEMWRLNNSLKAKPAKSKLGRSNAVPVKAVFPHGSFVVFEPDYGKMKMKNDKPSGTYWIRIKAGKFTDEYVVDFY